MTFLTEMNIEDIHLGDNVRGADKRRGFINSLRYSDDGVLILSFEWTSRSRPDEQTTNDVEIHRCSKIEWFGHSKRKFE